MCIYEQHSVASYAAVENIKKTRKNVFIRNMRPLRPHEPSPDRGVREGGGPSTGSGYRIKPR